MRQIFILTILVASNSILVAQELPKFIQDKIDFCDSNLSSKQVTEFRIELDKLEGYFVKTGLLKDKSGRSYKEVYERIALESDLYFNIDTSFNLLDNLEFKVYTGCFYKVLTQEELSELTNRHQILAEKITENYEGNITPSIAANLIIKNFTNEDFEMKFYQVSALLGFYRLATPRPDLNNKMGTAFEKIEIVLDENNKILVDKNALTIEKAKLAIYEFLQLDPLNNGIVFSVSKKASYESYLEVYEMLNSVYSTLNEELKKNISKKIVFIEPK